MVVEVMVCEIQALLVEIISNSYLLLCNNLKTIRCLIQKIFEHISFDVILETCSKYIV